ncbi:trichohyalin-like isoform X2 [Mizuhopecten yessoensis]|uniref:trichohyalin-like isoform X2 n=1 Tax=Mizuhopecten yessoensis TaxID=6573 RepID=UPI000B45DE93|nr:trichohyalin-like isoform X2 [Mizuhopecten yessoensis]
MACNMTPVFIKSDSVLGAALMNEIGSARSTHQESSVYDRVMSRIQNVCTEKSVEENILLGVEFWESLKKGTLQWITVPGGLYVYDCVQGLDFGSAEEHGNLILRHEFYGQCMEEYYTLVTTVEVSEPSQDWIGQEMIQTHVRVIKEMLKFTDAEIRNGLEILHGRGEAITFASLIHTLGTREDAVVNVYVGTRKYAFSADVQLVLHECYDFYGREPTQAEFDYQYNRIKEHLINQLAVKDEEVTNINRDKERLQERARLLDNQVTTEQARAVQERNRADRRHREKLEALQEVNTAMEARNEAQELANEAVDGIIQEQNKARALKETMRLKTVKLEQEKEAERVKNVQLEQEKEEERVKAEAERVKNVQLEQEKEEERVKAEAERVKNVQLEQEKEEERVKAEAERVKNVQLEQEKEEERVKAEAERVKNVQLEQEKEEERVKAEAERVKNVQLEQEKEEERVKAEAERVKNVQLEQEKEEERVKAEAERVKAEAEREQLQQFFEEEKRKMMAQFEAEKRQLLLKMQQSSLYAR